MSRIISHRGNMTGPSEDENLPARVEAAMRIGFDCEVDVWAKDDNMYLGHDKTEHPITCAWLVRYKHQLICHVKNLAAIPILSDLGLEFFMHEGREDHVVTSKGHVWMNNNTMLIDDHRFILMGKDIKSEGNLRYAGICTDYPVDIMRSLAASGWEKDNADSK